MTLRNAYTRDLCHHPQCGNGGMGGENSPGCARRHGEQNQWGRGIGEGETLAISASIACNANKMDVGTPGAAAEDGGWRSELRET